MSYRSPSAGSPDDLDFSIPTPPRPARVRSSTIAGAAGVLAIAGLFSLVGAALLAGSGHPAWQVWIVGAFGGIQLVIAVMVYRQEPIGWPTGLAAAGIGLGFGLVRVIEGTGIAVLDMVAYAFVIWALGTNRGAFRRE